MEGVAASCVCHPDWVTGGLDYISFLGVLEGVSGEMSIQISGLRKVDHPPQCGWASSQVPSKTREEAGGILPLFPCLTVGAGTARLVFCLQSSCVPSLWTWDLTAPQPSWAPACRWQMGKFSASIHMQPIPHYTHAHTHTHARTHVHTQFSASIHMQPIPHFTHPHTHTHTHKHPILVPVL